jgi:outer membrane protein OmpA-like peptidoglycan-associated protein
LSAEVKQPEVLTVMVDTVQNILCHGDSKGFIDINVNGGVFPYTYVWSNGDNTEDLVNVMAGSYAVKVKDANGCIKDLTAQVEQPAELVIRQDSLVNITCAGDETGLIKVSVEGGEGPYEYKWNTGQTTQSISGIGAGTYRVLVTDANGCQGEFTTEVNEPSKLISSIDAITDIRCNSDSSGIINVTVREGTAPYKFEWSNGATTEDIRNVAAGDYSLTITEGNGCKTVLNATIEQPTMFYASIKDVKDVKCFGNTTGAVTVDASGGVTPYTFNWSNGSTEQNIFDVGADSYSVMVTDANGCIRTLNAEIEEPPLLTMRIDSVYNVKCCGDKSGAIFITVEGGVEPYQYKWSNGETTQDITNLELGVYTVEVTDANGCTVATPDDMSLYEEVVSKGKFTTRDINFDIGKSVIRPESFTTINRIASFMKEHPDISFRIDGHTDSDGSADFNQKLSEDRAKAIRNALIKFGIRASRLETKGWGEEKPIATNTTQEGKAENRRVEFVVLTGTLDGDLIESEGTSLQK